MLVQSQQTQLTRRCARLIAKLADALPDLLARCEPEAAAGIIVDLVKTHLSLPEPQLDPAAALAEIVNRAMTYEPDPEPASVQSDLGLPLTKEAYYHDPQTR